MTDIENNKILESYLEYLLEDYPKFDFSISIKEFLQLNINVDYNKVINDCDKTYYMLHIFSSYNIKYNITDHYSILLLFINNLIKNDIFSKNNFLKILNKLNKNIEKSTNNNDTTNNTNDDTTNNTNDDTTNNTNDDIRILNPDTWGDDCEEINYNKNGNILFIDNLYLLGFYIIEFYDIDVFKYFLELFPQIIEKDLINQEELIKNINKNAMYKLIPFNNTINHTFLNHSLQFNNDITEFLVNNYGYNITYNIIFNAYKNLNIDFKYKKYNDIYKYKYYDLINKIDFDINFTKINNISLNNIVFNALFKNNTNLIKYIIFTKNYNLLQFYLEYIIDNTHISEFNNIINNKYYLLQYIDYYELLVRIHSFLRNEIDNYSTFNCNMNNYVKMYILLITHIEKINTVGLLDSYFNNNSFNIMNDYSKFSLHLLVAKKNSLNMLKKIDNYIHDYNICDEYNFTPIMDCAKYGSLDTFKFY